MLLLGHTPRSARCRHFGACGGCAIQDLPYEEQLARKGARLRALLEPLGVGVSALHPSPEPWYYRNKMEFSFGDVYPPRPGGPPLRLGLKARGRWFDVLDLDECFLMSPEAPRLLASVRQWAVREGVAPYNAKRHVGTLRHLVVREAKNAGERLALLVAAPGPLPETSFLEAVTSAYPATTVLIGENAKVSDTALADTVRVLAGPGHVTERLRFGERAVSFRISPYSFFQTNTLGTERLYGVLRRWLGEGAGRLLDLYCGGGGIALSLADLCQSVTGVEVNAAAVSDARRNAEFNGAAAQFYCGAVEALLPSLLAMAPETVVVDPPRPGLHSKALAALLELGPPRLLYVSCNPEALARDLKPLLQRYAASACEAVDLFPHTDHVETAVQLVRAR